MCQIRRGVMSGPAIPSAVTISKWASARGVSYGLRDSSISLPNSMRSRVRASEWHGVGGPTEASSLTATGDFPVWPTRARGTCNSRAVMRLETTHAHTPVVLWAGIEALPGSDQYRQPLRCGASRLIRALGEGFQHELEDRVVEPRDHDPVPGPGDLPTRRAHAANEREVVSPKGPSSRRRLVVARFSGGAGGAGRPQSAPGGSLCGMRPG